MTESTRSFCDFSKAITINLLPFEGAEKTGWDEFDRPTAHPANSTSYARLYCKHLTSPIFLEARIKDEKIAQWLLGRRRMIRKLFKPYLFTQCGPQVRACYSEHYDEIFLSYVEFLLNVYRPINLLILNHALVRGITRTALEKSKFRYITECIPYVNELDAEDEVILGHFHASHRNDTRKAIKESYRYEPNIGSTLYFPLSAATYARSGLQGQSKKYLEDIENHLVQHGRGFISGVFVEDMLVSASIIIHHGDNAYYLHGASMNPKPRGSTTFLHYKNMLRLRDLGVKYYDMGGAKLDENSSPKSVMLTQFKSRFGGNPISAFGGSLYPFQNGVTSLS